MTVALIAAMSENRVIGRDGRVPWHLPDELKYFKRTTMGHTLIMGRRTFDSVGVALPGRRSIVLTRRSDAIDGVEIAGSLDAALRLAEGDDEIYISGGESVYSEALGIADRIFLTVVHTDVEGDRFFPEFDLDTWSLVEEVPHASDQQHAFAFTFRTYDRRG